MKRFFACVVLFCMVLCLSALAQEGPLELQRSVSREYVGIGGTTTLVYRVENTGDMPLEDLSVTDPLCGLVLSAEKLAPGEYRSAQVSITVTKTCRSEPRAVWYENGEHFEMALEPAYVSPAENSMGVSLWADRESVPDGGAVILTVEINNRGNTELYDIVFTEINSGSVGSVPGVLAPGESITREFETSVAGEEGFAVSVQARTCSDETVSAQSSTVYVSRVQAEENAKLSISAKALEGEFPRGTAGVGITLRSEGGVLENVTVSERNSGVLRTFVAVAPGETYFETECALAQPQEMLFLAQYTGADGSTTVLSETVWLTPGSAESGDILSGGAVRLSTSAYAVFMYWGLGVLALFVLILLIVSGHRSRRRRIEREKRARRMRILRKNAKMDEAEWVQTRPHDPVSLKNSEENEN